MGQIDDFIHAQCAALLVEGERIQGTAFLRQPAKGSINMLGVVGAYGDVWLAAGTNQRLILLLSEAGGLMKGTPKAICTQVIVWPYKDLKVVTVDRCKGVGADGVWFHLESYEPHGPNQSKGARYDVNPQAQGVDGQNQFFTQFPTWLQQKVAAGTFIDPKHQAAFAQQQQAQQAQQAVDQQRRAEASARRSATAGKMTPWIVPVVVAVIALVGAIVGLKMLTRAMDMADSARKDVRQQTVRVEIAEAGIKRASAGTPPPDGCPEKDAGIHYDKKCHGCDVSDTQPPPNTTGTVHQKGSTYLRCPTADEAKKNLEQAKVGLATTERMVARWGTSKVIGGVITTVSLVVGIGFFLLWMRKRRRLLAKVAPPTPPTPPASSPPSP